MIPILSAVFWLLTYTFIIISGFVGGTYGMPGVALCANLSWEFIFGFLKPHKQPQRTVNRLWLLFDFVILYQFIKYGPSEFASLFSISTFYVLFSLALVLSFALIYFSVDEFDDHYGRYAAFSQNLLMSVLFVLMLLTRNSLAGQSIYIAIFKWLGTLLPCYYFYRKYPKSHVLNTLYVGIFIFDVLYIGLIAYYANMAGINPWLKFF